MIRGVKCLVRPQEIESFDNAYIIDLKRTIAFGGEVVTTHLVGRCHIDIGLHNVILRLYTIFVAIIPKHCHTLFADTTIYLAEVESHLVVVLIACQGINVVDMCQLIAQTTHFRRVIVNRINRTSNDEGFFLAKLDALHQGL